MKILGIAVAATVSAIAVAAISIAPARAAAPFGTWLTGDGKGKIRIEDCDILGLEDAADKLCQLSSGRTMQIE